MKDLKKKKIKKAREEKGQIYILQAVHKKKKFFFSCNFLFLFLFIYFHLLVWTTISNIFSTISRAAAGLAVYAPVRFGCRRSVDSALGCLIGLEKENPEKENQDADYKKRINK